MFNMSYRKVGGIRFIRVGRINIQVSITSWETIEARAAARRRQEWQLCIARAVTENAISWAGYEARADKRRRDDDAFEAALQVAINEYNQLNV